MLRAAWRTGMWGTRPRHARPRPIPFVQAKVTAERKVVYVGYFDELGRQIGWGELDRPETVGYIDVKDEFGGRGYGTAILRDLVARGARRAFTTSEEGYRLFLAQGRMWRAVGRIGPEEEGWGPTDMEFVFVGQPDPNWKAPPAWVNRA